MVSPARASSEIAKTSLKEGAAAPQSGLFGRLRGVLPAVAEHVRRVVPAFARQSATAPAPAGRAGPVPQPHADGRTNAGDRRRAKPITRRQLAAVAFGLCVLLPTLASFLYLAFVAVPQFRSEARFVVRGNLKDVAGSGSAVGNLPALSNYQEARLVLEYTRSHAIIDAMQKQLDLRRLFGITARDPVFGLAQGASEEMLLDYWNRQVKASLEVVSGVITLDVYAFSPESAAFLGAAILRQLEAVANELTVRNRGDRVLQAETEERAAFTDLALVRTEVEAFRNAQGTVNPVLSAAVSYAMIGKLRDQRAALNTDLSTARARLMEDSPVVRALKERLRSLDEKIEALDTELLGRSDKQPGTSSNLLASAELEVRRGLAEQRLRQAETELLDARLQQAEKQVYILTFMSPTMLTEKNFPNPLSQTMAVFATLFACWAVVALCIEGIYARSH
ncbi:hypothetical protein [Xanthobacter aminoxidans]|uniref:hypothetical protein n=1 Tax=Xanthobacter aminoxidans TaxID=186280 RepID=UPI002022DBA8|nr:hypothetical protein [Xanthobacter aminoxidans]MCL8382346.1 hypothetical protein [Xanthobacter aminoxidans]